MNKKQIVWLFIRLFSVFLLYRAVFATLSLVTAAIPLTTPGQSAATFGIFTQQLIVTTFYWAGGIYLLTNGKLLFRLINSESKETNEDNS